MKNCIVLLLIIMIFIFYYKSKNYFQDNDNPKYLIMKTSGGLFHMLVLLSKCITFCRDNNKILIIDSKQTKFGIDFDEIFYIKNLDYSTSYDKIPKHIKKVSGIPISKIKTTALAFGKGGYYLDGINPNAIRSSDKDEAVVRWSCGGNWKADREIWDIFIKPEILEVIKSKKINDLYIGVHFRNTDKRNNINDIFIQVHDILNTYKYLKTIFLATDDYSSVSKFQNEFKNINIINFLKIKEKIYALHMIKR